MWSQPKQSLKTNTIKIDHLYLACSRRGNTQNVTTSTTWEALESSFYQIVCRTTDNLCDALWALSLSPAVEYLYIILLYYDGQLLIKLKIVISTRLLLGVVQHHP